MNLAQWLAQQRGRQAALAAHLRIKPPQVAAWVSGKRQVPLEHCPFIQAFTAGAVTCEELRPDQAAYFALIRRQAGASEAPDPVMRVHPEPDGGHERRDLTRPSRDTGTDWDRRRVPTGADATLAGAPAGEG